jgi:hypothetical protein
VEPSSGMVGVDVSMVELSLPMVEAFLTLVRLSL